MNTVNPLKNVSMNIYRQLIVAAMVFLMPMSFAQLEVTITQGDVRPIPIAVVPFGWGGAELPEDVAAVVDSDLGGTGRFKMYPRRNMLETPTREHQVDYQDWALLGVEYLLIGHIDETAGGVLQVGFQLFDIVNNAKLSEYAVLSPNTRLRSAGHYVADKVYEDILGVRGAFSTRIAYITQSDAGDYELIVADADGENAKTVVRSREPVMSPSWSPDSEHLAYVIFENGGTAIYVRNIYTGAAQRVSARQGVNGSPAWSPDGSKLALTLSDARGNLDVHVLTLSNGDLKRITRSRAIDTEAVWSADGSTLYFNSDRSNGPQIYQVSSSGGQPTRLTFEGKYNARPRLSPDGKSLAVVHNDRGNYKIALVDLKSGNFTLLSDGPLDESPSFSPNGQVLIYATTRGQRGGLATVTSDGQISQELTSKGVAVREPVWSPFAKGTN